MSWLDKKRRTYEVELMVFMWLAVVYLFTVHWMVGCMGFMGVSLYWLHDENE